MSGVETGPDFDGPEASKKPGVNYVDVAGRPAPPKPWERNTGAAGRTSTPLGPSSASDGQPKPWEQSQGTANLATPAATSALTPSQPARPWERDGTSGATSPLMSSSNYSSGYGSSMYGNGYGMNSRPMYGRGYGSSSYGTGYGSMYGSGGYGNGYGSTYGNGYGSYGSSYGGLGGSSYGMGGYGGYGGYGYGSGGYGSQYSSPYGRPALGGPSGPYEPGQGPPPQPPSAWQHMLAGLSGIVGFFGRLSFLVDENAHAIHFFISALLQLLDRAGSLYGEMARFVLRLLGYKGKQNKGKQPAAEGPPQQHPQQPGVPHAASQQPAERQAWPNGNSTPWQPNSSRQLPAPSAAAAKREPGWDSVWKASD